MLELLGERNERIEQLEMDVRVGGLPGLLACLAWPSCLPSLLSCLHASCCTTQGRRASCLRHCPYHPITYSPCTPTALRMIPCLACLPGLPALPCRR
jgi:hypothetical protein